MKTIKKWLKTIDKDISKKALYNLKKLSPLSKKVVKNNLKDALHSAFPWIKSKEGFEYWKNIHDKL